MEKTILQYQRAFNSLIEKFKSNEGVLAVMVFGSMVTGDLWDESDIDLFVILDKKPVDIKNIYTEEKNIPVHIKLMSKNKFCQLHEEDLRGGFIHRIFASSRLVFSKDAEITEKYDNGRYYPDIDRERWNMVYLGKVLKNMSVCRKYIANDGIYTAYTSTVKCIEEFAKLFVNASGYMISKDAMTMAMNFNEEFKILVDNFFFNKKETMDAINDLLNFMQLYIDKNIRTISNVLLSYMKEKDSLLSAENIKRDELFSSYDISIEDVLNKLWERNIIKKDSRDYKDEEKIIIKENVYYI